MLVSGVLFVVFLAGCWLAWVITRRRRRAPRSSSADAANLIIVDYSAADILWYPRPSAPLGPDDDPEFLRQLAQRINGNPTDPAELAIRSAYRTPA
jgi:tryptophanyl-tRNA synthetase